MGKLTLLDIIKENFIDINITNINKVMISAVKLGLEFKIVINNEKEVSKRNQEIVRSIDYKGIGELVNLTDLEVVFFEEHLNKEEIAGLKELQNLRVDGHDFKDIMFLKELKKLNKLLIPKKRRSTVTVDISILENLEKLSSLDVRCSKIIGCEAISKLEQLEYLCMGSSGIEDLKFIHNCSGLKELKLYNNENLSNLKGIEQILSLQNLDLGGIGAKAKFDEIGELVDLVELNLSCNKGDIDVSSFKKLKKLEKLTLDLSKVKNFEYITELSALKELRLETVKTVKDFTAIGELSYLETLVLRKNRQLTDISFLAPLKNLKHLEIYECGKIDDYSAVGHVEKVVK